MATSAVTGKPLSLAILMSSTDAPAEISPKWAFTPVISIIKRYFAIAMVSAIAGIIGKPWRDATNPSCTQPSLAI